MSLETYAVLTVGAVFALWLLGRAAGAVRWLVTFAAVGAVLFLYL